MLTGLQSLSTTLVVDFCSAKCAEHNWWSSSLFWWGLPPRSFCWKKKVRKNSTPPVKWDFNWSTSTNNRRKSGSLCSILAETNSLQLPGSTNYLLHIPTSLNLLPSLKLTLPLKMGLPKRKLVFQPSIFRGYVSFREGITCFTGDIFVTSHEKAP